MPPPRSTAAPPLKLHDLSSAECLAGRSTARPDDEAQARCVGFLLLELADPESRRLVGAVEAAKMKGLP